MRLPITFALILGLTMATSLAWPQGKAHNRYRWTDSHGAVQYADSPTAEALQVGYDVIDSRGNVVKHVDRVKTAAEKSADASAAAATAQEKRRAAEAAQSDQQMLRAYTSEQALIDAQTGRLAAIDQELANVKVSEAIQEKSLAEQLVYASTFERDGKPVPPTVKQQIETLRANVAAQQKFTANKLADRAESELRAKAELARYRELRAAQQKTDAQ